MDTSAHTKCIIANFQKPAAAAVTAKHKNHTLFCLAHNVNMKTQFSRVSHVCEMLNGFKQTVTIENGLSFRFNYCETAHRHIHTETNHTEQTQKRERKRERQTDGRIESMFFAIAKLKLDVLFVNDSMNMFRTKMLHPIFFFSTILNR